MSKKPMRSARPRTRTTAKVEWEPKTPNQELLRQHITNKLVTFAVGVAGTGKSFIGLYTLIDLLNASKITSILISRPLVSAGEEFGFLPGTLDEKVDPFLGPLFDILYNHPQGQHLLEGDNSPLITQPIALMRGCTFDNGAVFIDEAQNLSSQQLELLLTRVGKSGKLILAGDMSQTDLKKGQSGLAQAVNMFKDDPDVGLVEFGIQDIQRSDFTGRVIQTYFNERSKNDKP